MKTTLTTIGLALLFAPAAMAQDPSLPATYGDNTLPAGFSPDPQTATINAGGPIDAAVTLGGPCVGFIAEAPDLRLFYEAGDGIPLTLYVESGVDTTLVVNAPNGDWWCSDDDVGLDPGMTFDVPLSGQYDIWIGTYLPDTVAPAMLFVTELE